MAVELQPRLIRMSDAPGYLGMSKTLFNQEVRPKLPELKIGQIGVAFDRLDLDAWIEEYKGRSERPSGGTKQWGVNERVGSQRTKPTARRSLKSTKSTTVNAFSEEAYKRLRKQNATSPSV